MKSFVSIIAMNILALTFLICLPATVADAAQAPVQLDGPVVVSVQIENGARVYKLNGKTVEDSKENSLLTNLAKTVKVRGTEIPVFLIIDLRAPFSEVGKLETALDKVELIHSRRVFVTDFRGGTMNEIHWDEKPIPIPVE